MTVFSCEFVEMFDVDIQAPEKARTRTGPQAMEQTGSAANRPNHHQRFTRDASQKEKCGASTR
jgi:hypothetical protein